MASISTSKATGRRRIQFIGPDGRKTIHIGSVPKKAAETIKTKIEALNAANLSRTTVDDETARWVGSLDAKLYDKLAKKGLVPKRGKTTRSTLAAFIDAYIAERTDVGFRTAIAFGNVRRCLVERFGEGRPLAEITAGDADEWRRYLARPKDDVANPGQGLAENTVRRRCAIARQFFRAAVRRKLIIENPFADMKAVSVKGNRSRDYFVTRDMATKVREACPDAQWRLLFVLSRFGGLRCPSEHLALRWGDVDWEKNRITIHSPKTAHHAGKESRVIPLFPELRADLEAVWDAAEPGSEYVISRYRDANQNLRTQLERIIRKAGLRPWPKLFQNLRSTRQTELSGEFPAHIVCAWIGNSTAVAREHYLQVTSEHFEQATKNGAQNGAASSRMERTDAQGPEAIAENCEELAGSTTGELLSIGPAGLEPATKGL